MPRVNSLTVYNNHSFRKEGMVTKVALRSASSADENDIQYALPRCPKECAEVIDMSCPRENIVVAAITTIDGGYPSTRYQVVYTSHAVPAWDAIRKISSSDECPWYEYFRELHIRRIVEGV